MKFYLHPSKLIKEHSHQYLLWALILSLHIVFKISLVYSLLSDIGQTTQFFYLTCYSSFGINQAYL